MNIKVGTKVKVLYNDNTPSCVTVGKIYTIKKILNTSSYKYYFNCDIAAESGSKHPCDTRAFLGKDAYLKVIIPELNSNIKIL